MQKLKLNSQSFEKVVSLIKAQCCNCYDGNCLLLDDGEAHICPQLKSVITEIMSRDKPNQREFFKMPMERLKRVAPKIKEKDFEDFVIKSCAYYYRVLQRQKDKGAR